MSFQPTPAMEDDTRKACFYTTPEGAGMDLSMKTVLSGFVEHLAKNEESRAAVMAYLAERAPGA